MKLSEAIILGSIGSEQGFTYRTAYKESEKKCVIGAALLGAGDEVEEHGTRFPYKVVTTLWPWTAKRIEPPINFEKFGSVIQAIAVNGLYPVVDILWILNDVAQWTRPQIAEWVKTVEPKEVEEAVECTIQTSQLTLVEQR